MESPLGCAIFICLTMALSFAGLVVVRRYVNVEWLKRQNEVASFFFLMIGTLYAVLIAFAVYVVWSEFQDAGTNLQHEANEVGDLSHMATAMPEPLRGQIHAALMEYMHAVLDDEFPAMNEDRDSPRTWKAMENLWNVYANAQPSTIKEQVIYAESMQGLNSLANDRRTRLFTSRGSVPLMLWYLLLVGGILLIVFTFFFGHDSLLLQGAMTASLAGVLAFSIFLIFAYDSPFSGSSRVSPLPYELELSHVAARH